MGSSLALLASDDEDLTFPEVGEKIIDYCYYKHTYMNEDPGFWERDKKVL